MSTPSRRDFLKHSAAATIAASAIHGAKGGGSAAFWNETVVTLRTSL